VPDGRPLPQLLYLEDVAVGDVLTSGWYRVGRDEIVDFARRWDPQPFHLDEEAARASIFGGLAACAPHLFAILSLLSFELPGRLALVAGLGGEGLQLVAPVLAGTEIRLRREFTGARPSKSRPGTGVVSFADALEDREGRVVFRTAGSALVEARPTTAD
jgi:acyl dehydratase